MNPGLQSADPKLDGTTVFHQWISSIYHTPKDNMSQHFYWDSAAKSTRLSFLVGYEVAQQSERPTWNTSDFFGTKFAHKYELCTRPLLMTGAARLVGNPDIGRRYGCGVGGGRRYPGPGRTWRQILDRDRHVYDVTIDPGDRNIVYAAGFESSAWRSMDRGEHCSRIPGVNFKWAYRVIPDPVSRGKVYASTFGGSLWHGSVTARDAAVDIASPELQPGH